MMMLPVGVLEEGNAVPPPPDVPSRLLEQGDQVSDRKALHQSQQNKKSVQEKAYA